MRKGRGGKKTTTMNWNTFSETVEKKTVDDWDQEETPVQVMNAPKKNRQRNVDDWDIEPAVKKENEPKMPEGLSWDDQQEYLMRLEEEEAKKSPYYCDDFEKMELDERILHGIFSYGFDKPSIVQSRAIKAIKTGRDCIVQAQSGTGKTATFSIGTLSNIDYELKHTQAIIMAPTRELADQIHKVITALGNYTGCRISLCCGQMYIDDNIKTSQVIVGTTGRILDLIGRGLIDTSHMKLLILDEADEMLSDGFKEQVYEIYQKFPENIQVCIISATLSPEVIEYSNQIMEDPIKILIKQEFVTLRGISQFYVNCIKEEYKLETLLDIYKRYMYSQSIVYVNSKNKCCWLASELIRRNYTVLYIDSSMPQKERSRIMREFRNGTCRILITTNLLSRGIDVQGVNLVINYDLPNPNNIESYVHRIGRCGRYGRKGVAINFITPNDYYIIQNIRKYYSTEISELPEDVTGLMTQ